VTFGRFVNFQIHLDWRALVWLTHLTGGISSPILFFFVFHAMIAAQLLTRCDVYLQVTPAVVLVALVAAGSLPAGWPESFPTKV